MSDRLISNQSQLPITIPGGRSRIPELTGFQVYCKEDDDGLNTDDDLDPIKEDLVGEATALPASPGKSDGDEKSGKYIVTNQPQPGSIIKFIFKINEIIKYFY